MRSLRTDRGSLLRLFSVTPLWTGLLFDCFSLASHAPLADFRYRSDVQAGPVFGFRRWSDGGWFLTTLDRVEPVALSAPGEHYGLIRFLKPVGLQSAPAIC